MSLFPAYATDSSVNRNEYEGEARDGTETLALEAQLLASDNDEERESGLVSTAGAGSQSLPDDQEYYLDRKLDVGNLRVSTLYYPGRPQYDSLGVRAALGARRRSERVRRPRRAQRYYSAPAPAPAPHHDAELAQRTRAFRDMLHLAPTDEALWLRFIDFQEVSRSADAALSAASEAAGALPASRRVRAELHRLRAAALPPLRCLQLLRADVAAAERGDAALVTELWLRLLGCAGAAGGAELLRCAGAALAATRAHPCAYPHVLYAYGAYLRAAGLWEQLVLLLELVTSMNLPAAAFPPPPDAARAQLAERRLQELEDKLAGSALPLSAVWVRVERARAAAHWRACAGAPGADPQRGAQPADVADLLLPAAGPAAAALLLLHALRLAKVPLLPCSQYLLAAADGSGAALGDAAEADGGEALLALLRAARRLPAAHPARLPAPLAPLLHMLADPPHYFSDDSGYLSWVSALWDACCGWVEGARRAALLGWRLRWLHALQLAGGAEEARRVRTAARGLLKRWAGAEPLPFAQFARLEQAAGDAPAARRAALHALRAALREPAAPPHQRLYIARVAGEVCEDEACGAWATVCAALGAALPDEQRLRNPPPAELRAQALAECEARAHQLEQQLPAAPPGACVLDALLPAPAEWAAARARLAPPARRRQLEQDVLRAAHAHTSAAAARYWEQAACALVAAAARDHRLAHCARALAPLFPHNAYLALASSGAPLWAWDARGSHEQRLRALCGARSHRAALAHVLPALLRAAAGAWGPREAARVAAACARAGRHGAGGALLHAVRLEAEARAERGQPARALLAALDAHPHHKWLVVRGAAWCGAQAAALADVLLERGLRAHALLDELAPPQPHTY